MIILIIKSKPITTITMFSKLNSFLFNSQVTSGPIAAGRVCCLLFLFSLLVLVVLLLVLKNQILTIITIITSITMDFNN